MSEATVRVRRLGYGLVVGGLVTLAVVRTALPPARTTALLLGFLAVAALVLERTQGTTPGVGIGLVTAAAGAALWPRLGVTDIQQLGTVLLFAGALNAVAAPLFARLQLAGERLGGGDEEE